ncbi:hypothetical protein PIIN_06057 [Serendipita indica DSM 11827]|uniref:Uncharacterized protein n=1 Tax=Serendipita indica (strain DSM 11827) TaxID=1109443 RepID=G4TLC8_SERID|nr:hypothetical protein PIIN_06057 [Serendipita indica DSM 11827]
MTRLPPWRWMIEPEEFSLDSSHRPNSSLNAGHLSHRVPVLPVPVEGSTLRTFLGASVFGGLEATLRRDARRPLWPSALTSPSPDDQRGEFKHWRHGINSNSRGKAADHPICLHSRSSRVSVRLRTHVGRRGSYLSLLVNSLV